ncbi:MAG: NAD-dependent epimerase/dehydratase family protein [Aureispira sp.]
MKKKIVITGISSSIIQKLAALIDFSNYEVIGISRNPSSTSLDNINVVKGDLLHIQDFEAHLKDCYLLIHGAAITHSQKEATYYEINLEATKKLVDLANACAVERFAFISSNTAGKNSGAYGLTKLLAEEYIQKHFKGWTILRLSAVYGDNKKEGIEKLIHEVLDKRMVLCPVDIPCKLYPIHVSDAITTMFHRIFEEKYLNKVSGINGGQGFSFFEIIELTKRISKREVRVIFLGKRIMSFIKIIAKISPINLGIAPDQIDRLYTQKYIEQNSMSTMKLEDYIQAVVNTKK